MASNPKTENPDIDIDLNAAGGFLRWLDPGARGFTFQTFDDSKAGNRTLARILHGTLAEHAETLTELNRRGAAVCVTMNETDLTGTKRENIKRVRALVADLDGAPLDPVRACELKPHRIVETSPGHYHAYWRVESFVPSEFEDTIRGIAQRFDSDKKIALLTHRARLPGFMHRKAEPFLVQTILTAAHDPHSADDILAAFPPQEAAPHNTDGGSAVGENQLILPAGAPVPAALKFVEMRAMRGPIYLLRHYRGAFYRYDGTHHRLVRENELRRDLYAFLETAVVQKAPDKFVPYNPTKGKVSEVVAALQHSVLLMPESWEPPCWLPLPEEAQEYKPAPDMVATKNGILNLRTRELLPHDPQFFTPNCLDFDYDPDAPKPKEFDRFLASLKLDEETEDTLQEMFGYLLTSDTKQQKIFMIVGPRRGGKGTLVDLLGQLIGANNVTYQTMASLTGEFGRWPLIDKKLSVFTDARLGSRGNIHQLVETLLTISGGDAQEINRKYGTFWQGRLHVRFLITTNVNPALKDASGTIASRFIMMRFTESFFGKEDKGLGARLLPELPGILNWALDGLDRLTERGYFVQPKSSEQAIQLLEHIAAPVKGFVHDWCVTEPEARFNVKELYRSYCDWSDDAGHKRLARNMFGKELRDAVPTVADTGRGARRDYIGVALSETGEAEWNVLQAEKGKAGKASR